MVHPHPILTLDWTFANYQDRLLTGVCWGDWLQREWEKEGQWLILSPSLLPFSTIYHIAIPNIHLIPHCSHVPCLFAPHPWNPLEGVEVHNTFTDHVGKREVLQGWIFFYSAERRVAVRDTGDGNKGAGQPWEPLERRRAVLPGSLWNKAASTAKDFGSALSSTLFLLCSPSRSSLTFPLPQAKLGVSPWFRLWESHKLLKSQQRLQIGGAHHSEGRRDSYSSEWRDWACIPAANEDPGVSFPKTHYTCCSGFVLFFGQHTSTEHLQYAMLGSGALWWWTTTKYMLSTFKGLEV